MQREHNLLRKLSMRPRFTFICGIQWKCLPNRKKQSAIHPQIEKHIQNE
jgi:hypothetical protein